MSHKSSFLGVIIHGRISMNLNQKVIYIEDGSLNEKGEGGLRFEGKILIGEIYIAGGVYSKIGFGWRDKLAIYHLHLQGKSTIIFIAAGNSSR